MFFGQPVLRELLRKEKASCDVDLFIVGVVRELDHLAAIEEWWGMVLAENARKTLTMRE
jgi:hypothetical protein